MFLMISLSGGTDSCDDEITKIGDDVVWRSTDLKDPAKMNSIKMAGMKPI